MKFTDGYWLLREGVTMLRPAEVHDHEVLGAELRVHAPVKRIVTRGDTLNTPVIEVSFTAPREDVIAVRIRHFAGTPAPLPRFALETASTVVDPEITHDEEAGTVTYRSGRLAARVALTGPWHVEYLWDGELLTSSTARSIGFAQVEGAGPHVLEQLSLDVGEQIYGLGERFGAFVKNGQSVDIWNADGGTNSEQAYKNVPFFLSSRGYGVLVDDAGPVSFEVGSENVAATQFSVPGEELRYEVYGGGNPLAVIDRYTARSGRPPQLPEWSFGLWLSTSFTTQYDEETVLSFVDGMAERGIPLSVFHFDCFWMRGFHWSDFTWDPTTFPDPRGLIAKLHERGLKVCVWINPYIAQRSHLFAEGAELGHLVRRTDGAVWQTDLWQAGMGLVDFSSPAAREWFAEKLDALIDDGVDSFKTDFGERIPTEGVVWADGSDPLRMHNHYAQQYNQVVFDLLRERRGEGEAVVFARSATAGGQRFPIHWGGDCESTYVAMAQSLRGGLSLVSSGFGYWSHDIGGFEGTPDPTLFMRWVAFGLLSSHSRLHGSSSYRVPWQFGEEAVTVMREFVELKSRLMPYLLDAAAVTTATGAPVMRPMVMQFPEDPACRTLDTQYMLGEDLLVAPVFTASGEVDVYLPAGRWVHLLDGEVVEVGQGEESDGGRFLRRRYDVHSLGLFAREGSAPLALLAGDGASAAADADAGSGR
ncbi:alpha-xylosidase [Brachybacterium sp. J144]|uniref:alpha-xylosidase n=1 Tax=Brachybacterium sp. J144 TaxID=3116487 RepID=UPI002E7920FE|nr:alpha-xylosidase [Brachybacterium sp. J144]MEE1650183.1 alpha-xylosidase [Brachybacterium sp. J144]